MILAAGEAFNKTFGLGATFIGLNIVVVVIMIIIAIQIRGERQQNKEYRERRLERR